MINTIYKKLKALTYNIFFEKIWVLVFNHLSKNKRVIIIKNGKINN